jgi:hypothetical protein
VKTANIENGIVPAAALGRGKGQDMQRKKSRAA